MSSFYSIPGPAGTIQIGTVSSVPSTDAATVTNSGTPEAAILNFELPLSPVGSLVDGNAASPGIAFNSDPSTGFYLPGPGQLALSTSGAGRVFIDAIGRVGINTSAPTNAFTPISFKIGGSTPVHFYADSAYWGLFDNGGTAGGYAPGNGFAGHATNNYLNFFTAAQERLRIDSSGRVGIGTSSPASGLHLSGAATVNSRLTFTQTTAGLTGTVQQGSSGFEIAAAGTQSINLVTNGTERARITSDGKLGLGTSSVNALLEVNSSTAGNEVQRIEGSYSGSGSVTLTNWRRAGGAVAAAFKYNDGTSPLCMSIGTTTAHQFRIRTADTDAITIDSSQRVGVGSTTPAGQLSCTSDFVFGNQASTGSGGTGRILATGGEVYIQGGLAASSGSAAPIVFTNYGGIGERARLDASGRLLVGASSDSGGALLQVNGNRVRIATAKTPASASDTGTTGEVCWDASYIYVCTATNTWKRAALSTW